MHIPSIYRTVIRDRSIPAKECPERQRTVIAFAAATCGRARRNGVQFTISIQRR